MLVDIPKDAERSTKRVQENGQTYDITIYVWFKKGRAFSYSYYDQPAGIQ